MRVPIDSNRTWLGMYLKCTGPSRYDSLYIHIYIFYIYTQRLRVCTESQHKTVLSQSPLSSQSPHGFSIEILTHACAVYFNASRVSSCHWFVAQITRLGVYIYSPLRTCTYMCGYAYAHMYIYDTYIFFYTVYMYICMIIRVIITCVHLYLL